MIFPEIDQDLAPELLVSDLNKSINFWCAICGFSVDFARYEVGFACISKGNAHIVLHELGEGRDFVTGELEAPFGRGVNFQVRVDNLDVPLAALANINWPLYLEPEEKWYPVGAAIEFGVRQFLVSDPDGYLLRFQQPLGKREVK
ncbi:bleomycin resistance protein [Corynebacterium sp. H130]|uniref:bleomycin resistance protein n=1 Tax=Corynebacterium sp. H130 TaxID=3133444 RepID=UPI0030AAD075